MLPRQCVCPCKNNIYSFIINCLRFVIINKTKLIEFVQARGGGSKRTFGSPKSQGPSQNLGKFYILSAYTIRLNNLFIRKKSNSCEKSIYVDCNQSDQANCSNDSQLDTSWSSAIVATSFLIGPLFILLMFIIMIKFCFSHSYPKGYYSDSYQFKGDNIFKNNNKNKQEYSLEQKLEENL